MCSHDYEPFELGNVYPSTPTPARYRLDELWVTGGGRLSPIKDLDTDHLRNIKEYFERNPNKLYGNAELSTRYNNCMNELRRREASKRLTATNLRLEGENLLRRSKSLHGSGFPYTTEWVDYVHRVIAAIREAEQKGCLK